MRMTLMALVAGLLVSSFGASVASAAWAPPGSGGGGGGGGGGGRGGLSRYNDQALLQELGYRGYTCQYQAPVSSQVVNIVCDQYSNMIIELYGESGTKKTEAKYFMSSTQRCGTEKVRIMGETEQGRLYNDKTIAFCDPYTNMIKVRIAQGSISEVEKTFSSSEANCDKNADQFNSLF